MVKIDLRTINSELIKRNRNREQFVALQKVVDEKYQGKHYRLVKLAKIFIVATGISFGFLLFLTLALYNHWQKLTGIIPLAFFAGVFVGLFTTATILYYKTKKVKKAWDAEVAVNKEYKEQATAAGEKLAQACLVNICLYNHYHELANIRDAAVLVARWEEIITDFKEGLKLNYRSEATPADYHLYFSQWYKDFYLQVQEQADE